MESERRLQPLGRLGRRGAVRGEWHNRNQSRAAFAEGPAFFNWRLHTNLETLRAGLPPYGAQIGGALTEMY